MQDILQFLGTIGIVTLGVICVTLSLKRNQHMIIVSGTLIFRWLSLTIVTIALTRGISLAGILTLPTVRIINSLIFLISVIGITWSISRHARRTN